MIYIFDIDGTLANLTHRLHFIEGPEKDWDSFYKACVNDTPIYETVELCKTLRMGNIVVYSTGRSEDIREETKEWLWRNGLHTQPLYMRKIKDHRPDYIVKEELLDQIIKDFHFLARILGAFEDRQQVVDMYRRCGIKTYQVADGKF